MKDKICWNLVARIESLSFYPAGDLLIPLQLGNDGLAAYNILEQLLKVSRRTRLSIKPCVKILCFKDSIKGALGERLQ